jgi:hypothetical protein
VTLALHLKTWKESQSPFFVALLSTSNGFQAPATPGTLEEQIIFFLAFYSLYLQPSNKVVCVCGVCVLLLIECAHLQIIQMSIEINNGQLTTAC